MHFRKKKQTHFYLSRGVKTKVSSERKIFKYLREVFRGGDTRSYEWNFYLTEISES